MPFIITSRRIEVKIRRHMEWFTNLWFHSYFSGVTLSREPDGMWIYNRSSAPVFVHSPTLSDMDSRSTHVFRVPPGHCLRAFDHMKYVPPEKLKWKSIFPSYFNLLMLTICLFSRAAKESYVCQSTIPGAVTGPIDKYSVRISFVKGWGPNYQRTEVISCPCWLEVLLSPCRWHRVHHNRNGNNSTF